MPGEEATELPDSTAGAPRKPRRLRYGLLAGGALAVAAIGVFTWKQVEPNVRAKQKYGSIVYEVPEAPQLTAAEGETIYRIDPTQSSLTYEVSEEFAGREASTATGVSNGIAGDIALNADDLAASRVGDVVVDIEQFHSDNNLRDARIRQDFLESNRFPLATFEIDEISGLDGELVEGETYDFTMTGAVTVKDETAMATFDATARLDDGELTATATTEAMLSRFGAGPIRIAGLVSTSDDVTLTLELTAYDPERRTIPTTITGPDASYADDAPSFAETVQPVLEANCVNCHATGEMGASHVRLDVAGEAQAISEGLKTTTELGYMPPWPASDVGVELAHEMSLTQDEIDAIAAWADAGGPLDVDPETPLVASDDAIVMEPRHDVVLERPSYTGSTDTVNDYRCFVLDPELTEPMFLTGYEFLEDASEVLHHAQVFQISAEQAEDGVSKSGEDGKPGWECFSGPNVRGERVASVPGREPSRDPGFTGQDNLVAGWVPGQSPAVFTEGTGFYLNPGDALVLQMHYHYGSEAVPDASGLALQLDEVSDDIEAIRTVNPIAPVEIPCAPEDQDEPLCDRDAALEYNVAEFGPSGASQQAGLLMVCGTTTEELVANFDGRFASTSCDQVVPEDGTIIAVLGHMHTIGDSFRLTLDPDTDEETVLLDIPNWSFDWQMNYELAEPIRVERGQPVRIECGWDRDRDPLRMPKYTVFADGTEDEMCFGTYALVPDNQ